MLRKAKSLFAFLFVSLLLLPLGVHAAEGERWGLNMTEGVTPVSNASYEIHMIMFWICVVIGIIVFGFMFYTMVKYRKSNGQEPDKNFHESLFVEVLWTAIPTIILIVMAIPATTALLDVYAAESPDFEEEMAVKITGWQWKWEYEYQGEGVKFMSSLRTPKSEIYNQEEKGEHYLLEVDNVLVLPSHTKILFNITAQDVIHAWWVPALGVKKDAIPGFMNQSWAYTEQPGVYRGQCAELCGKDHGFMPIVVQVLPKEEFAAWMDEKRAAAAAERELANTVFTMDELMSRGKEVYDRACAGCHAVDGNGIPGVFPALKGSPVATTEPVSKHLDVVVNGVSGTAMQAFGGQLSEVDMAAVITYERNAWGNDTGDLVQPLDVLKFKQGE